MCYPRATSSARTCNWPGRSCATRHEVNVRLEPNDSLAPRRSIISTARTMSEGGTYNYTHTPHYFVHIAAPIATTPRPTKPLVNNQITSRSNRTKQSHFFHALLYRLPSRFTLTIQALESPNQEESFMQRVKRGGETFSLRRRKRNETKYSFTCEFDEV